MTQAARGAHRLPVPEPALYSCQCGPWWCGSVSNYTMAAGRWKQARLMLWKNWLFSVRSWKTTLLQLLAPLLFLLLVTGLSYLPQGLENVLNPPVTPLGTLPRCKAWNGKPCISLIAFGFDLDASVDFFNVTELDKSNKDCVTNIMTNFSRATGLSMNTNSMNTTADIHLVLSKSELKEIFRVHITTQTVSNYFTQHPNQTQAAVMFFECSVDHQNKSASKLNYTILYNSTRALAFEQIVLGSPNKPDGRKEIAVLIDSLFLSLVMGSTVTLNVSAASFPLYYQRESVATKQVRTPYSLSLSLPLSFSCFTCFLLILLLLSPG
ncbi:hypothetical protein GBAR_LOCUS21222 [Geodia barretti]|uniref:Uncharacterized protein n=1 Tax=Geodia barretti TaxID=519541 RepID=A0AA35WYZ0_GEOBA|nr:hypothetical protein GBAR_LOCUS21222 [Geodia barretti]